jgi:hypothetical protein
MSNNFLQLVICYEDDTLASFLIGTSSISKENLQASLGCSKVKVSVKPVPNPTTRIEQEKDRKKGKISTSQNVKPNALNSPD